ncbi:hypothetical protein SAMN05421541_107312 [Actinoplanes philippinensis]|uniref:Uncharacterized protein n=1 Tax=Actinoplanes philippinensis TaxID=35752 RepID=A0A1I2GZR9_9ACTN|nr:hypothetical protein SAMN05421541_107312 [Actinoplanes philippinensis]
MPAMRRALQGVTRHGRYLAARGLLSLFLLLDGIMPASDLGCAAES